MTITLDSLALPDDLLWTDEFAWSAILANTKRTLQGKLVVQAAQIPDDSGRPITLGNQHAWLSRSQVRTLQEWAGTPQRNMTLTLHNGSTYSVVFRHWEAPVIEAAPVGAHVYSDPVDTDTYVLTALKLSVV